jgi:glycosyltransferase involved in cell wall biosynthesis
MPLISVAIPTHRRLPLLRRAVESVFAQTFVDWEMVVSDNEIPSGETWTFLETLARADARIRPIKNDGPPGAVFNHNSALRSSRGEWIKLLHDDDVLKPNCLEVLARIVNERPDVVAVSCACESFVDGRLVGPFYRRDRALLEQMDSSDALLAMYVLDEACWALPTQQLVHRSVIDAGVLFEKPPGIHTLMDSWFNARVHSRGAALVYNSPLVEWHQGHETATSVCTEDELTAEFLTFRKLLLSVMPKNLSLPNVRSVEGMVVLVRALKQFRYMHLRAAIGRAASVWDAAAYSLAIRWLLRQYRPRRFSSISRTIIWRNEAEMAAAKSART